MVVPVTVGDSVRASGVPSLNSCASTTSKERSEATIAEFNTKVQVITTVDISSTGLGGLLVMDTETGEGTEGRRTLVIVFIESILYKPVSLMSSVSLNIIPSTMT